MKRSHTQLERAEILAVVDHVGYSNEEIKYTIGTSHTAGTYPVRCSYEEITYTVETALRRGRFRAAGDVAAMKTSNTRSEMRR